MKRSAPPVARNREPILSVLRQILPVTGTILEIASGTGEHCVYFATALSQLRFQPSDIGEEQLASIEAWRRESGLENVLPARRIDVTSDDWGIGQVEVVFCANMIHIAPPAAMTGLIQGSARHLLPGGILVTYGPYRRGGAHTAPSNAEFEKWLWSQSEDFGVRDLEELESLGVQANLELKSTVPMPANNFILVFEKGSPEARISHGA